MKSVVWKEMLITSFLVMLLFFKSKCLETSMITIIPKTLLYSWISTSYAFTYVCWGISHLQWNSHILTIQLKFYESVHLYKQYSIKIGTISITLESSLMPLPNQPPSPEAGTVLDSMTFKICNLMYNHMMWFSKESLTLRLGLLTTVLLTAFLLGRYLSHLNTVL